MSACSKSVIFQSDLLCTKKEGFNISAVVFFSSFIIVANYSEFSATKTKISHMNKLTKTALFMLFVIFIASCMKESKATKLSFKLLNKDLNGITNNSHEYTTVVK